MFLRLLGSIAIATLLPIAAAAQTSLLILFGVALSLAMPVISTLPAQSLSPQNRALGFGIYFVWLYVGTPFLTAAGGWLRDRFGTARFSFFYAAAVIAVSSWSCSSRTLVAAPRPKTRWFKQRGAPWDGSRTAETCNPGSGISRGLGSRQPGPSLEGRAKKKHNALDAKSSSVSA